MKKINLIPNKSINFNTVTKLLKNSSKNGQFTNNGPNVQLLESTIRHLYKIEDNKAIVAVSNGSIAVQLLAMVIEVFHKQKINWCSQSFTFPPSVQMNLSDTKIVDIDLDGGIDLGDLDNDTDGLIITNVFGNVVDIDKYIKYCEKNQKFLIFDNAATHFTFYKGKNCLNYGCGASISFHHTKPMGFGEGGAIILDKKYENTLRCLINFGYGLESNPSIFSRYATNGKMSDVAAVYIIQYLENKFQEIVTKHKQHYVYLKKKLTEKGLDIQLFPSFHDENEICVSCFCLLFHNRDISIKMKETLLKNDIFCRKYYHPMADTKNATDIYDKILCIPCNIQMDESNLEFLINLISDTLQ